MNHPKPSGSRNFNSNSSRRCNDDENTTDEENPDLYYMPLFIQYFITYNL